MGSTGVAHASADSYVMTEGSANLGWALSHARGFACREMAYNSLR